jgi:ATP-dependent helicase/nuclease subunit A
MEPPAPKIEGRLTPSQRQAVIARGNVLVMAGAGTGKTHTLIERCLHCLYHEQPPASLGEILVVTFTEAAAAEMRRRLREQLEEKSRVEPDAPRWAEQLALFDTAHIGTLHGFCLRLVREHFHELGLDPQLAVLDEGEARLLANETLGEELDTHYAGQTELAEAIQKLIQIYGNGRDPAIRQLVLHLHHYAQTRPDANGWLAQQIEKFAAPAPEDWRPWLLDAVGRWRDGWVPTLENLRAENSKAAECLEILNRLPDRFSRRQAAAVLGEIQICSTVWPPKKKAVLLNPLLAFLGAAGFLHSLATVENGRDPLAEDWEWVRGHMGALLRLTEKFSARFAVRKRDAGVLDFHDLEQFALKLLWNFTTDKPTSVAGRWRQKIRFVFVDEYQDINAAQDKIIRALSRDGADANRFLVGDVKQSIYRFRLADPKIFRDYAQNWRGNNGQTIALADNFRSRESLLNFINSVFAPLMRQEIGGVGYDAGARLQFGAPQQRAELGVSKDVSPRAELLLRFKTGRTDPETGDGSGSNDLADLPETEQEARLLAWRLKRLEAGNHEIWDAEKRLFRPAEWRDMAVLMRAPAGKAEIYAKEFQRAGVPLVVQRGRFYDSSEVLDLLSLLQLLDNPLQDVPAIAVLRSPLAGLSLDELALVRLAASGHFWTALNRTQQAECGMPEETVQKIGRFLKRFAHWRQLARQVPLSLCLESVLSETLYADWLLTRPRGTQRQANVGRFLGLAQKFDQFQRQGLFRFLKFIEAQREAEVEPDVEAMADGNAVRLMSIHQSKGLEFPVVAVTDLAKPFNTQDLRSEIIFDETFGLCPRIQPPLTGRRYPSLPHWLAQQHQRREQWGEELRLLYVALTRARDTLVLIATVSETKWESLWTGSEAITPQAIVAAKSYSDWLGMWFAQNQAQNPESKVPSATGGQLPHLRWRLADESELAAEPAVEQAAKELPPLDEKTGRRLQAILAWKYPFAAATRRAAKSSVTELRRRATEPDEEAERIFPAPRFAPVGRRQARAGLSAADTGRAHHKFLQFVALEKTADLEALKSEASRLKQENILTAEECAALILEDIAAFWESAAGRKIRTQAATVRREMAFTARFSPVELEDVAGVKSAAGLEDELVVVQGVADLVVVLPEEIWLVDFKTDDIRQSGLPDKIKAYAPQLNLYARALEKIYARPVTARWLHFLAARRTESI